MLDIKRLQYLVAVYRYRSFTRASEELFVTQPAISLAVKANPWRQNSVSS